MSYRTPQSLAEQLVGHAHEWAAVSGERVVAFADSLDALEANPDVNAGYLLMVVPPDVDSDTLPLVEPSRPGPVSVPIA